MSLFFSRVQFNYVLCFRADRVSVVPRFLGKIAPLLHLYLRTKWNLVVSLSSCRGQLGFDSALGQNATLKNQRYPVPGEERTVRDSTTLIVLKRLGSLVIRSVAIPTPAVGWTICGPHQDARALTSTLRSSCAASCHIVCVCVFGPDIKQNHYYHNVKPKNAVLVINKYNLFIRR